MAASREEFAEWLEHPVTKDYRKRVSSDVELMKEMLISTDLEDVKELQGRIKTAMNLLDISYEAIYE